MLGYNLYSKLKKFEIYKIDDKKLIIIFNLFVLQYFNNN